MILRVDGVPITACMPGAHNPASVDWRQPEPYKAVCTRCGRRIVFRGLVWILDESEEQ